MYTDRHGHASVLIMQVWIWRMEGHDLYFEREMPIRFKVQVGPHGAGCMNSAL